MVQQKLRTMFFRRNGKVMRVLQDLGIDDIDFHTAGSSCIFAHTSRDDERRFLAEALQRFPELRLYGVSGYHALHDSAAVPQLREQKFSTRTQVIKPTLQLDFFADMFC